MESTRMYVTTSNKVRAILFFHDEIESPSFCTATKSIIQYNLFITGNCCFI